MVARACRALVVLLAVVAGGCSQVLSLDALEKTPCTDCGVGRSATPTSGTGSADDGRGTTIADGASTTARNPLPAVATMAPSSALVGTPGRAVRLGGAGFAAGAVVRSDGRALPTTFVSTTELTATLSAADLATARILTITVENPAPGGGTSGEPKPFVVASSCEGAGVDVPLGTPGTVSTRTLDFNGALPTVPLLAAGACPASLGTEGDRWRTPFRTFVVQNTNAASVTLSAWTVCSSSQSYGDDAILTFYRRETPLVTDNERLACAVAVSEGSASAGRFASTEANGAPFCPGLHASNGGALRLASCEKAVVYVQANGTPDSAYPPPPYIRFRPD